MEPNQSILNDAARHLRINSRGGIFIPAARRPMENLTAALTVTRFFLQEFGLSRDIARLMNIFRATATQLYEPLANFAEPPDLVALAIDHIGVFQSEAAPKGWIVSCPKWLPVPGSEGQEYAVLPFYPICADSTPDEIKHPLYNAILFALQLYLFECLKSEMRGVQSDYLALIHQSYDEDDSFEAQHLAQPALHALVKVLPVLRGGQFRDVQIDETSDEISLVCGQVVLRKHLASGLWSTYYQGLSGWKKVNPLVAEPAPTAQILPRRDFLTYFTQVAAILAERKVYEVEKLLRMLVS